MLIIYKLFLSQKLSLKSLFENNLSSCQIVLKGSEWCYDACDAIWPEKEASLASKISWRNLSLVFHYIFVFTAMI